MTPRLLMLDARCPVCGARPNIRIPDAERELASGQRPDHEKQTYQCHRKHCRTVYPITALAYQRSA